MGPYKRLILERDRYAKESEHDAERALYDNTERKDSRNELYGLEIALDYILNRFKFTSRHVTGCDSIAELLECTLEPLGIMYEEISLKDGYWKKRTEYIIGFLESGETVLFVPYIGGYRYMVPGSDKKKKLTKKVLLKDTAYVVHRPFRAEEFSFKNLALYMLKLISPRDYIPIAAATGVVSVLGLATPAIHFWVLGTLIYERNIQDFYKGLILGAVMFLTIGLITCIIKTVKTIMLGSIEIRISAQIQAAVMARTLLLPHSFFLKSSSGRLSKRIGISRTLGEKMVQIFLDTLFNVVFSIVYIPQMVSYAPALYTPALLILLTQIIISIIASVFYIRNQVKVTDAQIEVGQFLFSTLKGIQKIKGFGAARLVYAKWADLYRNMLSHSLNPPLWVKLSNALSVMVASFGTILLLGAAVPGRVSMENYVAFNTAYSMVASIVSESLIVIQSIFLMGPLMNYMKPIFSVKIEPDPTCEYVKSLDGDIELNNVKFAYLGSGHPVLRNISLKIKKGEKVAIVGESGCGKSTLLNILMGFETPQQGNVYFDGKSIDQLNKCSLRKRIGSVFQFSRVMPGTIASNISFTTADLTEADLWDAAEKACIADYIKSLDMGMETEVTQSNIGGFSGGQKQCILLARAFAKKPSVLILDEATSALDNITQDAVLKSVSDMKATVIMVAHRLSTVKDCDRILVMKDGEIIEEGPYEQLMDMDGYFRELVNRQIQT